MCYHFRLRNPKENIGNSHSAGVSWLSSEVFIGQFNVCLKSISVCVILWGIFNQKNTDQNYQILFQNTAPEYFYMEYAFRKYIVEMVFFMK